MKRIWSILLALTMMLALALPAAAAENTASTMRLMETEGTVSTENSVGTALTVRDGMRLFSGYQVATEAASYAYIALDNSKTAKLDASSAAKVAQSGKQLELNATAGSLFFNVPVALKAGESMNIRSSTMVTGIRGTAGWVRVLDRYTTRIALLEGTATIHSRDPLTGANRSVTIHGGQIATIILHEKAAAMTQQLINQGVIIEENIVEELTKLGQVVEELQEDNVPGFVASEVAKDKDLQQRINAESPLNAAEIALNAPERLAADEAAAFAADDDIQNQLDNTKAKDNPKNEDEVFTEPEVIVETEIIYIDRPVPMPPSDDEEEEEEEEPTIEYVPVLNTDDPDYTEVNDSLLDGKAGVATVTKADLDLADLNVEEGDVLNIVSGTLTNTGNSIVDGTINIFADAELVNEGSLVVNSTNSIHIYGTLTNENDCDLYVGSEDGAGKITVYAGGTLDNSGCIWIEDEDSIFRIQKEGTLINRAEGEIVFDPDGENFTVRGSFQDYAHEVYSEDGSVVTYLGSFEDIAENPENYKGETFKVLNAGTVTSGEYIYCDEDTKLTLDMNGNSAKLVSVIPMREVMAAEGEEGAEEEEVETEELGGLALYGEYSNNTPPETSFAHLTITDSVGGGKLTGGITVQDCASFAMEGGTLNGYIMGGYTSFVEMSGGTVKVPAGGEEDDFFAYWAPYWPESGWEYCPGIATYESFFSMSGGTIDASASGTCALDLDPRVYLPYAYEDEEISLPATLVRGTLIGRELMPYSRYYTLDDVYAFWEEEDADGNYDYDSGYLTFIPPYASDNTPLPILSASPTLSTSSIFPPCFAAAAAEPMQNPSTALI